MLKLYKRNEFQHFYTPHNEKAFLKSIYEKVWQKEEEVLSESCTRFRENVSLTNYFMRYWQLCENKFFPEDVSKSRINIQLAPDNIKKIEKELFNVERQSLCLNDSSQCTFEEYEYIKPIVIKLFEKKYPNKSNFEL